MTKVAIIGGGLVGTSVAHRLVELGVPLTLFDREDDGQATSAGAGLLPPLDHFIGIEAVLPLLAAARAYYPELVAALEGHDARGVGYDVIGALHVALDEREQAELPGVAAACERLRGAGFGHIGVVTELTAGKARSLFPLLGPGVLGAVHCSAAARVDGRRLLAALRARVLTLGGEIRQGSAVPWTEAGRVVGVRASGELLGADALVIAGGAWSSALLSPLGIEPSIVPQRGQLIHLELPGVATSAWPMVLGFSHQYLLAFPGSRVVVGATREDGVGFDARTTVGGVQAVLDQAFRLAPSLRDASLREARVGLRPISADRRPLIGPLPGHSNVFVAAGHGGYGLEVGPYSGALLAELIAGRAPSLDLAPFAPGRFATVAGAVAASG
jgi:glycine/D-amino acid oxidase-like deaminating enzyme